MDPIDNSDLEGKGSNLIDFFSEDDSLISSSISGLDSSEHQMENRSVESLGAEDSTNEEETTVALGQAEPNSQPHEVPEPGNPIKSSRCNLRKSLAWDSAFFTSAGILDPEELDSIIGGVNGVEKRLPGIQEDVRRSAESVSTLDSDSLTLESIEAALFKDIRASIQKSSKAPSVSNSSSKTGSVGTTRQAIRSSEKGDLASRNRASSKLTSKKPNNSAQGTRKTVQPSEPNVRNSTNVSFPKPPKVTKGVSSTAGQTKPETNNLKSCNSRGVTVSPSKKVGPKDSRRIVPRPTVPSKPTSSTSTKSALTTSSGAAGKSPSTGVSRKINSRTVNPPSTGSMVKTPARNELKSRTLIGNSRLSTSSSKLSSSISPASSISEWSVESSSSTSTINQRSNDSKGSLGVMDGDNQASDVWNHPTSENVKKIASESEKHTSSAFVKPSRLRMPSPKIGFFDGVKSGARTPSGSMHSPPAPPTGPKSGSNKATLSNIQPKQNLVTKPTSPLLLKEPSTASKKVSSLSRSVQNCGTPSSKAQKAQSPKPNRERLGETKEEIKGLDGCCVIPEVKVAKEQNSTADSCFVCVVEETKSRSVEKISDTMCNESHVESNISWAQREEQVALDPLAESRTPFSVKNSPCSVDGLVDDISTRLTLEDVEKPATLPILESPQKENC